MKIRLALFGIEKPKSVTPWLGIEPSCGADFKGGRQMEHRVVLGATAKNFETVRKMIFQYEMFDSNRIWALLSGDKAVKAGDTVVQHARFGAFQFEFANRVAATINRKKGKFREAGITVVTMQGHPEQGSETFLVRRRQNGEVEFKISANSRPNHWLTVAFSPLTRWLQRKAVGECIERMKEACHVR